jgi:DNA-directed RNA polymerase subunit RPC12/RpoP
MVYDYECNECGCLFRLEDVPSQYDAPCNDCGGKTTRLITQTAIRMRSDYSPVQKGIVKDILEREKLEVQMERAGSKMSFEDKLRISKEIHKIDTTPVTGGGK